MKHAVVISAIALLMGAPHFTPQAAAQVSNPKDSRQKLRQPPEPPAKSAPPAKATPPARTPESAKPASNSSATTNFKHYFLDNVKVTVANGSMTVLSNGLPNHETGTFPNKENPNYILQQNARWSIPTNPQRAATPSATPMGPIGVAINGVPIFNYKNAQGRDAVKGPFAEVFDSCCGHPDPRGAYHYHQFPKCIKSPFKDDAGQHSPIIGYAFDGYAIYGIRDKDGKAPTDLDECNGHVGPTPEFPDGIYHYHCTETFPYTFSQYRGVVNMQGGGGGGQPPPKGGPGKGGPPPKKGPPKGKGK